MVLRYQIFDCLIKPASNCSDVITSYRDYSD